MDTRPEQLWHLFLRHWKLTPPKLVISAIGTGYERDEHNPQFYEKFISQLHDVSTSTGLLKYLNIFFKNTRIIIKRMLRNLNLIYI